MNFTISSLVVSSLSNSPMLMASSTFNKYSIKFDSISTKYFISNFFYSTSNTIQGTISKSCFINFIKTPLIFKGSKLLEDATICQNIKGETKRSTLTLEASSCTVAEILVEDCTFEDCDVYNDNKNGGGIYFFIDGKLIVHGSFFKNCRAKAGGGIEVFAPNNQNYAIGFYSHYCCYSSCSCSNVDPTGLGSAIHIKASELQVNYSSTLNCPVPSGDIAHGAQMDLDSNDFIASSHINSTYGNSKYCAGLEYRQAKNGYFKFQNFINHVGGIITSFNALAADVEISNCNIVNAKINDNIDLPCVLFVIDHGVKISNFIIFNISFNQNKFSLLSVQHDRDVQNHLIDSFIDIDSAYKGTRLEFSNVKVLSPENHEGITTRIIYQLNYKECIGEVPVTPPKVGEDLKEDGELVVESSHEPDDETESSHQQEKPDENPDKPDKPVDPETSENNENPVEPATSENNGNPVEPASSENNGNPVEPASSENNEQEGPNHSHEQTIESIVIDFSNITDDDLEKNEKGKSGSKSKAGLIAGVTVASVAVVGGSVAGIAYYLTKKKTPVTGAEGYGDNKEENQP